MVRHQIKKVSQLEVEVANLKHDNNVQLSTPKLRSNAYGRSTPHSLKTRTPFVMPRKSVCFGSCKPTTRPSCSPCMTSNMTWATGWVMQPAKELWRKVMDLRPREMLLSRRGKRSLSNRTIPLLSSCPTRQSTLQPMERPELQSYPARPQRKPESSLCPRVKVHP